MVTQCEYLPQNNFKWNTEEWDNDRILNLRDDGKKGYLFDVNLHYPEELHEWICIRSNK